MSRSGYSEDSSDWELIKWRGMVASATRGKRGQQLFRDLIAALDVMPLKRLIVDELVLNGEFCALGAVGQYRGVEQLDALDPDDPESVAAVLNIAPCLVREISYHNDERWTREETAEQRWTRMRAWAERQVTDRLKEQP